MTVSIRLKHSSVAAKVPLPADLADGELGLNINDTTPAVYLKDSAGAVVQVGGVGTEPDATETVKGVAELATQVEADAGTDDTTIITPLKMATYVGANAADGLYTYPGGVQQTVQARLEQYVSVKDFGAVGDGVTDDTAAIQTAVQASQHVILPAGTYRVSSSIALNAASNGLVLEGLSASIVPSTNRVQIFQIVGADSVTFKGITFDNSANGILQNEPKSSVLDPANYAGNGLNAVVYAAKSIDVVIQGCKFIEFNSGLIYIHDWQDNLTLGGTVSIEDCIYDGCSFGNLINNPSYLFLNNILNINNVDSLNSDAPTDPGHLLYVTDRSGAIPLNTACSNIQDSNGESSVIKIRKGENASVSNVTVSGSGKGVEVWNVKTGSLSNCSITLAPSLNSNNSALEVTDCGSVVVSNSSFDTRGIDAWAIRVRADGAGTQPYSNNGMTVSDCNLVTSFTDVSQVGKATIACDGQTNVTFRDLNFVHEGTIANTRPLIDFSDSSYSVVSSIKCRFVDALTIVDIVRFQANTNNCIFIYSPDALFPSAVDPYSDLGTNNLVTANYSASRLPVGSAASPTIAFDGSPTTGFYRSGANVVALSMNGAATYAFLSDRFQPFSDNTIDLGTGSAGWKNIYCDYVLSNQLRLSGLPTSPTGLQVGDVWNDSGTLKIV